MREVLLSRRWLILTVVIVAVQPAFAFLGWWQWGRGSRTHDIRNLGYAFQWWSFGILAIFGWVKMLHTELKERAAGEPAAGLLAGAAAGPVAEPTAEAELITSSQRSRRRSVAVAVAQRGATVTVEDDVDEELAAYNAYLAWLSANPRS